MERGVTTAVGANTTYASSYAAYGASSNTAAATAAKAAAADTDTTTRDANATSVILSDAAKAFLAANGGADAPSVDVLAANARSWFDQQYGKLGISSAVMDGQIAVDLTGQSRATLSAVASNTGNLFSQDEADAAAKTLDVRFSDAVSPYVVIARHTGDYAAPYDAAMSYLNDAGADEKATDTWKAQYQAVLDGLTAAKATFGKAPDTGNSDDPVAALLGTTASSASPTGTTAASDVASQARAMLDAQANAARDNGTDLTFDPTRKGGQQVDYTNFDNRSLATIVLNQGGDFSAEETRSAKAELDQRNRTSILAALNGSQSGSDPRNSSLALLKQYSGMSDEEKAVMGYDKAFVDRVAQNYRTLTSLQGSLGTTTSTGGGILSYL
jgi:hypothetical protein